MSESDMVWKLLGWIGILVTASVAGILAYSAFDALRSIVQGLRWSYRYKHRFDKPPTAACYCKDCMHHGTKFPNSGTIDACCLPGVDRHTPDNGFCYEARPRKKDVG